VTECQGCGAWNDTRRIHCVLCGTPLAETDEWDAAAELPPLPPLPDGGLSDSMPAWLRQAPAVEAAPAVPPMVAAGASGAHQMLDEPIPAPSLLMMIFPSGCGIWPRGMPPAAPPARRGWPRLRWPAWTCGRLGPGPRVLRLLRRLSFPAPTSPRLQCQPRSLLPHWRRSPKADRGPLPRPPAPARSASRASPGRRYCWFFCSSSWWWPRSGRWRRTEFSARPCSWLCVAGVSAREPRCYPRNGPGTLGNAAWPGTRGTPQRGNGSGAEQ
jgi:hypothetical protein